MHPETRRIMAGIRSRLTRYVDKVATHCGHDDLVAEAWRAEDRLMAYIKEEVEKLVQKGGGQ